MIRAIVVDDQQVGIDGVLDNANLNNEVDIIATFRSPLKAIEYAQQEQFAIDACFLDVRMPEIPGTRLALKIREMQIHSNTKIIFLSTYKDVQTDFAHDAYFLPKPFGQRKFDKLIGLIAPEIPERFEVDEDFIMAESFNQHLRRTGNDPIHNNHCVVYGSNDTFQIKAEMPLAAIRPQKGIKLFNPYLGHWINLSKIRGLIGRSALIMENQQIVPISRNKYRDGIFQDFLVNHTIERVESFSLKNERIYEQLTR